MSLVAKRWDPKVRAGALSVRRARALDIEALQRLTEGVTDWADYQNLSGDADAAEMAAEHGPYTWRSYLHEEAAIARRRAERLRARERKAEAPAPPPAPSHLYA